MKRMGDHLQRRWSGDEERIVQRQRRRICARVQTVTLPLNHTQLAALE